MKITIEAQTKASKKEGIWSGGGSEMKHLRRCVREDVWEARAKTREIRASRADMVLLLCCCCGAAGTVALLLAVAMEMVTRLLGFLEGQSVRDSDWVV